MNRLTLLLLLCAAPMFAAPPPALAQARVATVQAGSTREIVIGHVAGFTGPVSKDANEMNAGAQVLIAAVNERGGFNGRMYKTVVADDEFKPVNTVKLTEEMRDKAIALLPTTGAANGAALVQANTLAIPLVGAVPASQGIREWQNPYMFHIRASDRDQTERILQQQITVGRTKVALLVPNNASGEQLARDAETYLAKRNIKLAVKAEFLLAGPKIDLEAGLKMLQNKDYQALIVFAPSPIAATAIKAVKTTNPGAQIYSLSYAADPSLIVKIAGEQLAHGVAIAQVMPRLDDQSVGIVKEFQANWAKFGKGAPSFYTLEGYIAARLIIDAVRRSQDPSSEGVRRGLEKMNKYDLGGYVIDFSTMKHEGSRFVELSLISSSGRLLY